MVLTLFSLLLTLSITRPLNRLRRAVHDLGQTAYQKDSLARLARRGDELGTLARDFNRMGERLQSLIGSQRQLLRDVSTNCARRWLACASPWPWPNAPNRKRGRRCGRAWNRNATAWKR